MQQYSIELPKQRVELYTVVTRTLLENRNLIKNIKPTPEAQAIQRLGPIAYTIFEVAVGTVLQGVCVIEFIDTPKIAAINKSYAGALCKEKSGGRS